MKDNNVKKAILTFLAVAVVSVVVVAGVKMISPSGSEGDGGDGSYIAGTYTGSGSGFGGEVTVTVTVNEASITDVLIVGDSETPSIGGAVIEDGTLTEQILTAQSADIDGASGATLTSNGVKDALNDALAQARGTGSGNSSTPGGAAGSGSYTPGEYTATGSGFGGEITVTVTVDESSITAVTIDGSSETPTIGGAIIDDDTLVDQIMAAQSADIDGVSGATMTSNGVKEALSAALSEAQGQ